MKGNEGDERLSGSEIRTPNSEMGKRPRRMIVWLVAVPIVILLLALAGANWKTFHLAYCRHLLRSSDHNDRRRSVDMVVDTHLRQGMSLEKVRAVLEPAQLVNLNPRDTSVPRSFQVFAGPTGQDQVRTLLFDKNDRLLLDIGSTLDAIQGPQPPWR